MTLTMSELAGVADSFSRKKSRLTDPSEGGPPTADEIARHAQLRQKVSDQELAALENEFRIALQTQQRVAEDRRRCGQYQHPRKPEEHGFSTGCTLEANTLEAASNRVNDLKARLNQMRDEMRDQRMESYEVDVRQDAGEERNAPITYVRSPTGLMVPVRDPGALARQRTGVAYPEPGQAPPARRKSKLPLVIFGLGVVGLGIFFTRR
jgi:hypothetical protein